MFLVCFYPEVLGHTDNNIPANPYSTPRHIVPEWYLLGYYAILRSIPNKLAGVQAMLQVFICVGLLPWAHKPNTRGPQFRLIHQILRVQLAADYVLLSFLGQCPVEHPYVLIGQIQTGGFFGLLQAICAQSYLDTLFSLPVSNTKKVRVASVYCLKLKLEICLALLDRQAQTEISYLSRRPQTKV